MMDAVFKQTSQNNAAIQKILQYTYGIVPVVAGLDKFTNLLTNWKDYLGNAIVNMLPISTGAFMHIVGIIEMAAGILVFIRPHLGAWVVMCWLILIALVLISGGHYDTAVRDLVMAVGAWVLARLSVNSGNTVANN